MNKYPAFSNEYLTNQKKNMKIKSIPIVLIRTAARSKFLTATILFSALYVSGFCQAARYYPKGDPHKLQVELTVPLWLPWIKGTTGVDGLLTDVQGDINATPGELLGKLKGVLMLNADVSKGGFVGFVNYMHIKLGTENTTAQLPQGGTATWSDEIKTIYWILQQAGVCTLIKEW
jgi:hypothetical protein